MKKKTLNNVPDKIKQKFIEPSNIIPRTMQDLFKIHKNINFVSFIASGCGTPAENLSIIVEICLFFEVFQAESRIQDESDCMLFSYNKVNMLPSNWFFSYEICSSIKTGTITTNSLIQALKLLFQATQL